MIVRKKTTGSKWSVRPHHETGYNTIDLKTEQLSYQQKWVYLGTAKNCNPGHPSYKRTRVMSEGTVFYRGKMAKLGGLVIKQKKSPLL